MVELALALNGDSAHAPPSHILENVTDELAHARVAGAPHSIYEEVWHAAFWLEITLDWVRGVETPCPERAEQGFPPNEQMRAEPWVDLCGRFLAGAEKAATIANCTDTEKQVMCPSPAGKPPRKMSVRDQLESLAAHNAYHLGRVVLLRQMLGSWPPPSGGFTW